ncbi:MAG: glycoside hydrolase family 99-like domain-containing protein, partial [Lentisphaeria bacterium]|nr:glycoside hydrolase family 99-like domain-containing protein [Lentisphaeria bacterium]
TRFGGRTLLYGGKVTRETFEKIAQIHVEKYFSRPDYYTIDGKPYFSLYELNKLLESFGSAEETRRALEDFRRACKTAGLPGLHLNCVVWTKAILPGETVPCDLPGLLSFLGFDSITSYVWKHHAPFPENVTPFDTVLAGYLEYWERVLKEFRIEYFPNVSMGWDSSPRTVQTEVWDWDERLSYPYTRIISGNTPERFGNAVRVVAEKLLKLPQKHKIMNINSWNEWTEGSYLEPDQRYGTGYLEALKKVYDSLK